MGVVVVTTSLEEMYAHYLEMRDIQIKGTPEYNAYNFLVGRLWCGRGASLSFQRVVVESILHEIETREGPLWLNVVRSLKKFLSKTGEKYNAAPTSGHVGGTGKQKSNVVGRGIEKEGRETSQV